MPVKTIIPKDFFVKQKVLLIIRAHHRN